MLSDDKISKSHTNIIRLLQLFYRSIDLEFYLSRGIWEVSRSALGKAAMESRTFSK